MMYPLNHCSVVSNRRIRISPHASLEQRDAQGHAEHLLFLLCCLAPSPLHRRQEMAVLPRTRQLWVPQIEPPAGSRTVWQKLLVHPRLPPCSWSGGHLPANSSAVLEELTARDMWASAPEQERKMGTEGATLTLPQEALGLNITAFIVVKYC